MFYVVRRNEGDHLQNMLLVMNVSLSVMLIINCRVLGLSLRVSDPWKNLLWMS